MAILKKLCSNWSVAWNCFFRRRFAVAPPCAASGRHASEPCRSRRVPRRGSPRAGRSSRASQAVGGAPSHAVSLLFRNGFLVRPSPWPPRASVCRHMVNRRAHARWALPCVVGPGASTAAGARRFALNVPLRFERRFNDELRCVRGDDAAAAAVVDGDTVVRAGHLDGDSGLCGRRDRRAHVRSGRRPRCRGRRRRRARRRTRGRGRGDRRRRLGRAVARLRGRGRRCRRVDRGGRGDDGAQHGRADVQHTRADSVAQHALRAIAQAGHAGESRVAAAAALCCKSVWRIDPLSCLMH